MGELMESAAPDAVCPPEHGISFEHELEFYELLDQPFVGSPEAKIA
jgi:hypothetical protein